MSLDNTVNVFILYGCTLSKERSSMRIVAATTDEEMLHIPVPTPPATVSITRFWQITSMPMRAFQRHRRQLCWPVPCLAGMFLLPILPVTMQRASRSNREKRKRPPDRRNISTSRQSSSGRTTSLEPRLFWMKRWKIPTVKCLRD